MVFHESHSHARYIARAHIRALLACACHFLLLTARAQALNWQLATIASFASETRNCGEATLVFHESNSHARYELCKPSVERSECDNQLATASEANSELSTATSSLRHISISSPACAQDCM